MVAGPRRWFLDPVNALRGTGIEPGQTISQHIPALAIRASSDMRALDQTENGGGYCGIEMGIEF